MYLLKSKINQNIFFTNIPYIMYVCNVRYYVYLTCEDI